MELKSGISAVITGGASGLGEATARALVKLGVKVALFDLQKEKGENLAGEIGATFCEVNVTNDESVLAGFAKARAAQGQERVLVYCAGTALRLARFNTNIAVVDKRYFQGLPSPAAAALVAGFIWVVDDFKIEAVGTMRWIACIITLFAGLTMVSNIPFYSFKDINFRRSVPFWAILLVVFAVILISTHPPTVLFLLFVAYSLSGYVVWVWKWRRRRTIA